MTPIPATAVLSVLQRVADGSARDVRIDRGELEFTLYADGWTLHCHDLGKGDIRGIERTVAPDGTVASWDDWISEVWPDNLLSDAESASILAMNREG